MAIVRCVECGRDVSDRAESCPKCGCPVVESLEEAEKRESDGEGRLGGDRCPHCNASAVQFATGIRTASEKFIFGLCVSFAVILLIIAIIVEDAAPAAVPLIALFSVIALVYWKTRGSSYCHSCKRRVSDGKHFRI